MDTAPEDSAQALAGITREDRGRVLAALARRFGDLDLAEDVTQDAMARALEVWPRTGVPDSPVAWLMTTARRRALDLLRRESTLAQKLARLHVEQEPERATRATDSGLVDRIPDDRLALFYTCAHPALRPEERVALTLRFLAGLTTEQIAHAFFVPVATLQQRIVRAKKRIATMGIPFEPPRLADLPARTPLVLRVVAVLFTEGHTATTGDDHLRADLSTEAIRLARLLARMLPHDTEVRGLLALLLLTEARRHARTTADGTPVPLDRQDRTRWDAGLVHEGLVLAERAAGSPGAGTWTIQASIAAVHAEAPCTSDTDWRQIVVLYDLLDRVDPGPLVALGRAVALGKATDLRRGLAALDALAADPALDRLRAFHVARAITLRDLGRTAQARQAFARARDLPGNAAESRFLDGEIADLP
ncbi:RNA polymerase sigma factor [Brevibacterium litoralis]|uniref:RNA polymerase sigma factor n=1 Tax=Brevibacterium litoralis TaxID=3138935 RepID=UPI0032EEA465